MTFYIKRVEIKGEEGADDKKFSFEKGLNVVYGASNQGKTLLYRLIDYTLGSSRKLGGVKELEKYVSVSTTIISNGETHKFSRKIESNKISYTKQNEKRIELSALASSKNKNVSHKLLHLAGMNKDAMLLKNLSGGGQKISFRRVLHYFLVSEESMAATTAVFKSGNYNNTTPNVSLLKYLLTGEDSTDLIKKNVETRKILKDKNDTVINTLSHIIGEEAIVLEEPFDFELTEDSLVELHSLVNRNGKDIIRELSESENKKLSLKRDKGKFMSLKDYYTSSLEKLEYEMKSEALFELLESKEIPNIIVELGNERSINTTFMAEKRKLLFFISHVERAIEDLELELLELKIKTKTLDRQTGIFQRQILDLLAYEAQKVPKEIERKIVNQEIGTLLNRLEEYKSELRDENASLSRGNQKYKLEFLLEFLPRTGLTFEIERILSSWGMDQPKVEIKKENGAYDIAVNGKSRLNDGKGVRGIFKSAFHLGFLRTQDLKNSFFGPNFLILDSPIHNFEEDKENRREISTEEIWKDLALNYRDQQLIIIENEHSVEKIGNYLKNKINFIKISQGLL